mmetsp:Transcript_26483/g.57558  ORF Transcript_26483/g.57558 Transcript_26483/m.57558 type:complete len:712 (+) Transcript_26483:185-2320(+)
MPQRPSRACVRRHGSSHVRAHSMVARTAAVPSSRRRWLPSALWCLRGLRSSPRLVRGAELLRGGADGVLRAEAVEGGGHAAALADVVDQLIEGVDVRLDAARDDVRVRRAALELPLHLQLAVRLADDHLGDSEGVDALGDGVHLKVEELHRDLHGHVHRLVGSVHGPGAHRAEHLRHAVGAYQLHRRRRHRAPGHHLELLEVPELGGLVELVREDGEEVLVLHAAALRLRHQLEPVEHLHQLVPLQRHPQRLEARLKGVAAGVLAQEDSRRVLAHDADALGLDDLVCGLVLEHAVLVDAGLVREGVLPHDGLVRLHGHARVLRHHARGEGDVLDAQAREQAVHVVLAAEVERHRHLLEGGVAGALADAVDGALDLARPVHRPREGVAGGEAEVVLAVRRDHHVVRPGGVRLDLCNQVAELVRDRDAHRIRDVDGCSARLDHLPEDPVQELGLGASGILWAELNIRAAQAPAILNRLNRKCDNLILSLLQLVLHVNFAGRDERVDAWALCVLHGRPGRINVLLVGARKSADDRDISVLVNIVPYSLRDLAHSCVIVRRCRWETRLNNVNPELLELLCDVQLLLRGQSRTRTLLAIAQSGIKNAHVVRIVDPVRNVLRTLGLGWSSPVAVALRRTHHNRVRSPSDPERSGPATGRKRDRGGGIGRASLAAKADGTVQDSLHSLNTTLRRPSLADARRSHSDSGHRARDHRRHI